MHASQHSPLHQLDDDALLACLRATLAQERRSLVKVLRLIAEVDRRRLYAQQACASMFAYATGSLGLSESAAYKRIRIARAARRFPSIFERIADGRLHLSGMCVLVPHLTTDNHTELLDAASKLGKRRIEQLVAERFPKSDVPASVNKQPAPSRLSAPQTPSTTTKAPPPTPTEQPVTPSINAAELADRRCSDRASRDTTHATATLAVTPPQDPSAARPEPPVVHRQHHPQPLSADRYLLKVTVSSKVKDTLARCQDLLAAQIPDGDIATVLEHALDALLQKQLKRKYAVGVNARRTPSTSSAPTDRSSPAGPTAQTPTDRPEDKAAAKDGPAKTRSRAIPAAVRRAVYQRDGGQCAYIDPKTGKRCQARRHLQFHHRKPFARGGAHTLDNLCLVCATHNAQQARLDFGSAQIEAAIFARQSERADSPRRQLQHGAPDGQSI